MITVGRVLLVTALLTVAAAVGVIAGVAALADLLDRAEQELGS